LTVEAVLVLVVVAATWAVVEYRVDWAVVPVSILFGWLTFTLPIAFLYLVGHPPVMTLAPLFPSAESRAFRRELKFRQVLSDDEFHSRFFADGDVPKEVSAGVRRGLLYFDRLADRAVPADNLQFLDDELDLGDVLHRVGKLFGVNFTKADYPKVDGTLDNLIRLVHAKLLEQHTS
jgi:hypothetical protein